MATRPGQTNEVTTGKDGPTGKSGETKAEPFQGESPFQSKDGLTQLRGVADKTDQQVAGVPDVSWKTENGDGQKVAMESFSGKTETTKESIGNQVAGMILKNGDGSGRSLEQVRQSNPKLAGQIDKAAESLSHGKTPEELKETLRVMDELYKGLDPKPTDNRESKQVLNRAKRDPEYVLGVMNKAEELMKLPAQKREQEIRKIKVQVRGMYLDGGDL